MSSIPTNKDASLLPLHPFLSHLEYDNFKTLSSSGESSSELSPYFESPLDSNQSIDARVVQFWTEAQRLTCIYRHRLKSSCNQVRDEFVTVEDRCRSLCVHQSLSVAAQHHQLLDCEDQAICIERIRSNIVVKSVGSEGIDDENVHVFKNMKWAAYTVGVSVAGVAGILGRSMLAALDLVDIDDEYEDCVNDDANHSGNSLVVEDKKMVNASLVVQCCKAIMRRVGDLVEQSTTTEAGADDSQPGLDHFMLSLVDKEAILVESDGYGKRSFSRFCKILGNHLFEASEDELLQAFGRLLENLIPEDYIFLLKILVASGNATQCATENLTLLHANESVDCSKQLNEVDIALFRLTHAKENIQKRMMRLESISAESKKNALIAKTKGSKGVALSHMKRSKLFDEEAEQCGNILLNLEQMLESLCRSMDDRDTIQSYEVCADAMKLIRLDESEGGLGLNLKRIDLAKDEMDEELSINREISAKLAVIGVESLTTSFSALSTSDDINDELELEYQKLEEEMKTQEASRSEKASRDKSALSLPPVPEGELPAIGDTTATKASVMPA